MGKRASLNISTRNDQTRKFFKELLSYFKEIFDYEFKDELANNFQDMAQFIDFDDFNSQIDLFLKKNSQSKNSSYIYIVYNSKHLTPDLIAKLNHLFLSESYIRGAVDTNTSFLFYIPLIRNLVPLKASENILAGNFHHHLLSIDQKLSSATHELEEQIATLKEWHAHVVPQRFESIKNLSIACKYSVGRGIGGEFYDCCHKGQKILFLLTNTQSYLTNSVILSQFLEINQQNTFSTDFVKTMLSRLYTKVKSIMDEQKKEMHPPNLFAILFDLTTLTASGLNFGPTQLVSNFNALVGENTYPFRPEFFDQAYFEFPLERKGHMSILSPGLRKNTQDKLENSSLIDYTKTLLSKTPMQAAHELHFQVKKLHKALGGTQFLPADASMIFIEVGPNVLTQV